MARMVNPGGSFWNNLKAGTPSMINSFAQNYGDPSLSGPVRSSGLASNITNQNRASLPSRQSTQSMGAGRGMVRPPSNFNSIFNPITGAMRGSELAQMIYPNNSTMAGINLDSSGNRIGGMISPPSSMPNIGDAYSKIGMNPSISDSIRTLNPGNRGSLWETYNRSLAGNRGSGLYY